MMARKPNGPRLEAAIDARLEQLRDVARSGQTALTGKTVRVRDSAGEESRSRRFGGMRAAFPELRRLPDRDSPQKIAAAVERGRGKVYQRLRATVRRELEPWVREARTRKERPAVPAHSALTAKCKTCHVVHGKDQHRFHGKGAFHSTHLFSFNPDMKNPRLKHLKYTTLPDGRKFPIYKGEVLSRVPASAFTAKDEAEGSPRTRLILSTLTRDQLIKEYREALKGSFDRFFKAGKRYFSLVEDEAKRRGMFQGNPRAKTGKARRLCKNPNPPPGATVIYGRCLRIEAQKTQAHACDPGCARADHCYFHDFKKGAVIYGLPNGDILIKNSRL